MDLADCCQHAAFPHRRKHRHQRSLLHVGCKRAEVSEEKQRTPLVLAFDWPFRRGPEPIEDRLAFLDRRQETVRRPHLASDEKRPPISRSGGLSGCSSLRLGYCSRSSVGSQPTRSAEERSFSRARFWIWRTRSLLMRSMWPICR